MFRGSFQDCSKNPQLKHEVEDWYVLMSSLRGLLERFPVVSRWFQAGLVSTSFDFKKIGLCGLLGRMYSCRGAGDYCLGPFAEV